MVQRSYFCCTLNLESNWVIGDHPGKKKGEMRLTTYDAEKLKKLKNKITRFLMVYKFALDELKTRLEILKEEFQLFHEYNPIEHTKYRLKTPESIINKLNRKGVSLSLANIKKHVKDIAGMRITCSFISDIYRIYEMLKNQRDLTILEVKDYIKNPKPNGYQSLHLLVEVPVFMSDGEKRVCVEIQIRTIAMDFWASLEHKIFYKYDSNNKAVPINLYQELKQAAAMVMELDQRMERLHNQIRNIKDEQKELKAEEMEKELTSLVISNQRYTFPSALLELIDSEEIEEED